MNVTIKWSGRAEYSAQDVKVAARYVEHLMIDDPEKTRVGPIKGIWFGDTYENTVFVYWTATGNVIVHYYKASGKGV